jgi:hypothetical protein
MRSTRKFVYHRGGPGRLFWGTFDGYRKVGPLVIATDHRGTADGNPTQVWYTDVSVKLTG